MGKKLNVLYQFDNNYAPYAGISILSLYENNQDIDELNVYCALLNVTDSNIDRLNQMAGEYGRTITYLDTQDAMKQIREIGAGEWNGSLATWIKIFILEQFIGEMDSLLYIDSDTLVKGSLEGLCGFAFEGNAAACVVDSLGFEELHRLGLEKNRYYYNAGVILFNLEYFAVHTDYYSNMMEHLKRNVGRYAVNDQDLLNDYFGERIKKLSPRYNFQGIHCMYPDKTYYKVYGQYAYYSVEEIAAARENVCILHFFRVFGDYPWEEGNYHPLKQEFEHWKSLSLWEKEPSVKKERTLLFKIERLLYLCLPKIVFLRIFQYIRNSSS